MFTNFRDKIALSGIAVLIIGIVLLMFTFANAYGFLTRGLSIKPADDLAQTFGVTLAPLIETCISIMYLGVMGWIGSLITIRGVTIIIHTPQASTMALQQQPRIGQEPAPQSQKPQAEKSKAEKTKKENAKEEAKIPEPEMLVTPPKEIMQT